MAHTQRAESEYAADKLPWRADCDADERCKFAELFPTKEAARHAEESHAHDYRGQVHHNGMSITESLWVELDAKIDMIRAQGADAPELLKGRASGLAWALAAVSKPHYPTEQEVLKEAMRRWKMRHGEMDWEPTVGYKFWAPPPGQPMHGNDSRQAPVTFANANLRETRQQTVAPKRAAKPAARQVVKVGRNMSLAEQDMLRTAVNVNKFTVEQCMAMFKLSQEDVEAIIAAG